MGISRIFKRSGNYSTDVQPPAAAARPAVANYQGSAGYPSAMPAAAAPRPKPEPPKDPIKVMEDKIKHLKRVKGTVAAQGNRAMVDAKRLIASGKLDQARRRVRDSKESEMFQEKMDNMINGFEIIRRNSITNGINQDVMSAVREITETFSQNSDQNVDEITANFFEHQQSTSEALENMMSNVQSSTDTNGTLGQSTDREVDQIMANLVREMGPSAETLREQKQANSPEASRLIAQLNA